MRSAQAGLLSSLAVLAGLAALATPAGARDEASGREIMTRVTEDHRTDDERATAEMVIVGKGRTPRKRAVTMLFAKAEGTDDKLVIRFDDPADIRGTSLLTIEHGETEDQWLYLPALRKTRRIASGSKSERFAGTDFTYEDLRTEEVAANDYRVVRSEELEGHACWVIEASAATETRKKETAYGRRLIWVRKDHHIAIRTDFYDKRDRLFKRLQNTEWKELEGGVFRSFKAQMQDVARGTQTLMRYVEREVNVGVADREFTKEALARG